MNFFLSLLEKLTLIEEYHRVTSIVEKNREILRLNLKEF
jgi:hypothetical protein